MENKVKNWQNHWRNSSLKVILILPQITRELSWVTHIIALNLCHFSHGDRKNAHRRRGIFCTIPGISAVISQTLADWILSDFKYPGTNTSDRVKEQWSRSPHSYLISFVKILCQSGTDQSEMEIQYTVYEAIIWL